VPFEQIKAIHSFWLKVPRGGLLTKCRTSWFSVLKNAFGTQPLASKMPSELSNNCNGNNKLLLVGIADCCLISPFFGTSCLFASLAGKSCVEHERRNSSCTPGDWLDMDVSCAQDRVTINLSKQELEWSDPDTTTKAVPYSIVVTAL